MHKQPILTYYSKVFLASFHNRKVMEACLYVQDAPKRCQARFINDMMGVRDGVISVGHMRV
jgi:hypothetical protein